MKNCGNGTIIFEKRPSVQAFAAVVGKKEGEGPFGKHFDVIENDEYFGQESWEKAESEVLRRSASLAIVKSTLKKEDIDFAISGDLLNQCISSGYALREFQIPFFGVYGACSTMAESLMLGSVLIGSSGAQKVLCSTSSHFCSAEKQFRTPLEYGGQRTPNAQWTVTGSGSVILSSSDSKIRIEAATCGRVVDLGVTDIGNMGAAMAPAFVDTLKRHLSALGKKPSDYDLILSGDLGIIGKSIAKELFIKEGLGEIPNYDDCGAMIFDVKGQDTHAGGSGCGCSASMLCGYVLPEMQKGNLKNVLFAATGALMSPTSTFQGESIPAISHAVSISQV